MVLSKTNVDLAVFSLFLYQAKDFSAHVIDSKLSKCGLDVKFMQGMHSRNDHVLDHPAMKASLYLDPRYRSAIIHNSLHVDEAKEFIAQMKQRLNYCSDQIGTNEMMADADSDDSINIRFDAETAIRDFLGHNIDRTDLSSDFEATLDAFDPPAMALKKPILEYWNESNDYESLRDVANAIFAIPPTETEVERDFSALKFICSEPFIERNPGRYSLYPSQQGSISRSE
ncbi:uncharacterized protein LOC129571154 [Sitodiplosis mosellana]|uniref:uncharacterized protein LOC129571154 n=1 Tax=Sitodiplosis mosellana TaxID=263140 RepID=UPI0024438DEF|nr:uncharacterized protein LOC129571154 [Sitodiplosis mosellana]